LKQRRFDLDTPAKNASIPGLHFRTDFNDGGCLMFGNRTTFGRICFVIAAASLIVSFASSASQATIVGAQSFGDEMVGAEIDVFFQISGLRTAVVTAGLPGQGVASFPGFFDFSVTGDTFLADWQLTNSTTFDTILRVLIDLSNTTSPGSPEAPGPHTPGILFDDNSAPSTLNGYAGRQGAQQVNVGAPFIVNSLEAALWPDAMNLGDEYLQEEITYQGFGPLLTSIWRDDTDIVGEDSGPEVPEPSSVVLLAIAGCALLLRWYRR
jgi:hypothetical protein